MSSHALHERGAELLARLWNGLAGIRGLRLYGPPPGTARTATLSFTLAGHDPEKIATALAEQGRVRLARGLLRDHRRRVYGREADGFVRAGCAAYTSAEEVDRLVAGRARDRRLNRAQRTSTLVHQQTSQAPAPASARVMEVNNHAPSSRLPSTSSPARCTTWPTRSAASSRATF